MIEAHLNPFITSQDNFQVMFKDYIQAVDSCLQKALNAFYSDEVFGNDSKKSLRTLTTYQNIYTALLMFCEQKDIDVVNSVTKTTAEYKAMFHLDCEALSDFFICNNCLSTIINDFLKYYPGEFSDEFADDFTN